jgi:aspartyl/asparaginyl beta-hydroxylase (cupin superfamily)
MKHFHTLPIQYDAAALFREYLQSRTKREFEQGRYVDIKVNYLKLVDNLDEYPEANRLYTELTSFFDIKREWKDLMYGFFLLRGETTYGSHRDGAFVVHFPVVTSARCKMIIEEEQMHLPLGECTIVNSLLMHTAYNLSKEDRVHLIYTPSPDVREILIDKYFPEDRGRLEITRPAIY